VILKAKTEAGLLHSKLSARAVEAMLSTDAEKELVSRIRSFEKVAEVDPASSFRHLYDKLLFEKIVEKYTDSLVDLLKPDRRKLADQLEDMGIKLTHDKFASHVAKDLPAEFRESMGENRVLLLLREAIVKAKIKHNEEEEREKERQEAKRRRRGYRSSSSRSRSSSSSSSRSRSSSRRRSDKASSKDKQEDEDKKKPESDEAQESAAKDSSSSSSSSSASGSSSKRRSSRSKSSSRSPSAKKSKVAG
jgi:cobalamin biosynthesis Mg chelatase CobN